jgi:hypoxanthine phosphoribosyltransferase
VPLREVIPAAAIARRVAELGAEVHARLPPGPLTVVGVLRGAFVFTADLVRAVPREMTVDFLGVRSYGDATVSSGVVEITTDLGAPIAGRHVLLVEDIVDTGLTLTYILGELRRREPHSLEVCALLDKSVRRIVPTDVRFVGFQVEDEFVLGYGLDFAGRYRNLQMVVAGDLAALRADPDAHVQDLYAG